MDENDKYFIRVRGRVLGPYSIDQLKTLRSRGQFGRANEISTDRETWESGAAIEHLFAPEGSKKARSKSDFEQNASETASGKSMAPIWHYAVGDEQCGPATLLELRGLITSNQLMADDLVWKEGMADWTPLRDVMELQSIVQKANSSSDRGGRAIATNTHVYCFACGSPTDMRAEVCPKCGVRQSRQPGSSKKSRLTASLLAFFLGGLGIHHFYLGNTTRGVLYILFCWTFIPAIVSIIDFIILMCMSDAKFEAKYG